MNRPDIVKILITVAKAILIAGAIIFLGSYFGIHVREAGGDAIAANTSVSGTQSTSDTTP